MEEEHLENIKKVCNPISEPPTSVQITIVVLTVILIFENQHHFDADYKKSIPQKIKWM